MKRFRIDFFFLRKSKRLFYVIIFVKDKGIYKIKGNVNIVPLGTFSRVMG